MSLRRVEFTLKTLLSYLYPVRVARSSTRYNADIVVRLRMGQPELWINGALQSGPGYLALWKAAFTDLHTRVRLKSRRRVLVLGIGGGSVIRLIASGQKNAVITAVDIDPEVIVICRRYFGLSNSDTLTFVRADADRFLSDLGKRRIVFDLVIVDVYQGFRIPDFVESDGFPGKLRRVLAPAGAAVFNYSPPGVTDRKNSLMLDKLAKVFHSVYSASIYSNRFICVIR